MGPDFLKLHLFHLPLFIVHPLDVFPHLVFPLEPLSTFVADEVFPLRVFDHVGLQLVSSSESLLANLAVKPFLCVEPGLVTNAILFC